MRGTMIVVTTALAALVAAPVALAGPANSTELLSLPTGLTATAPTANDSTPSSTSFHFATSGDVPGQQLASTDGRYVVFTSTADGMSGDDTDNVENVYVRDIATNTTILVSRADGPTGAPANNDSQHPAISGNGRFVAFASNATNLFSSDTGGTSQVYVRDIVSGTTRLVSRATGGAGTVGDDDSDEPSIADSGNVIAFSSVATNLGGGSGHRQVYVRSSTTTEVVSTVDPSGAAGSADSFGPSVSGNGNFVAFSSDADLLPPGTDTNGKTDVYRRTLANTTESLASIGSLGVGNQESDGASIDDDGNRVAFISEAKNFSAFDQTDVDPDVYYRDFGSPNPVLVSVGATFSQKAAASTQASISADGTKIAFLTKTGLAAADTNNVFDVYIRTLTGPSTVLASHCAGGAPLDQDAFQSAIAPSGNRIYFGTNSDACSPDDDNDYFQVFQRVLTLSLVEPTQLISRPTGTSPLQSNTNDSAIRGLGRTDGSTQSISGDGRFTVFASEADELSSEDDNTVTNVFVRDAQADTTTLVSRASGAGPAGDAPSGPTFDQFSGALTLSGNATSPPAISANGQVVAFTSTADNLVAGDTNNHTDVFVRNLVTGVTTLVSVKTDGSQGSQSSYNPSISADGNRVAFTSRAQLDPDDPDADEDVYVRDIAAGTTTLASRQNGAGGIDANSDAGDPSISADGARVGFVTAANNLLPAIIDTNGVADVYVRDLAANTTMLASARNALPFAGDLGSGGASLDATGTHVAFASIATNLVGGDLGGHSDVFVRDLSSGATTLVSRVAGGIVSANGTSQSPSISGDGTRVAFETAATDLFPGDIDQQTDVVLRDLTTATTTLAARADGAAGAAPDARTGSPSLSANGHCLAFDSKADNLVPGGPPGTDFIHAYLRALDADCGFQAPQPQPQLVPLPVPSPGPTPDKKKPVISKLKLTHTKFKVGPNRTATSAKAKPKTKTKKKPKTPIGTTISYTLSEKATVSIVIERKSTGRRKRGKCVTGKSAPKHGVKCSKYVKAGTLKRNGKSGSNKVAFSGRVGSHKLSAGSYRLAVTATDPSKNKSSSHHISFRIVTR